MCYSLFLLLWWMNYWRFRAPETLSGSGRALNERQTPRHPLATLNAIRLVSFLQQGAFDQGLIIICLDKILMCLMKLVLQEPQAKQEHHPRTNLKKCVLKNPNGVSGPCFFLGSMMV